MPKETVLVADDDAAIRTVVNQALSRAGYDVRVTSNLTKLWQWISEGEGDCVVSDVILPDGDAFGLLPKIKKERPDLPTILISAQNTFMTALKAQETGAYEYLPKPFDLDELVHSVNRAIAEPKNNKSTQSVDDYAEKMPLVGRSSAMQDLYRSIARLTISDMPVMMIGQSGTGKRLTARVLHDFGSRKHGPFVPVNLAGLPEELIESQLFGRREAGQSPVIGAIQQADGGTLYLEEIGSLPMPAQTRLLRTLHEGEATPVGSTTPTRTDIRLISSTTQDLDQLISQGLFREDLFYRISVVPLRIPALRERREDIPDLARHFLKMSEVEGAQSRHLDAESISALREHNWPGNVRELENLIRRVCILHPQETVTQEVIDAEIRNSTQFRRGVSDASNGEFSNLRSAAQYFVDRYFEDYRHASPPPGIHRQFVEEVEYPIITATLAHTNGNQIKTAELLGINRNTLRKKIRQYGIRIVKTAK